MVMNLRFRIYNYILSIIRNCVIIYYLLVRNCDQLIVNCPVGIKILITLNSKPFHLTNKYEVKRCSLLIQVTQKLRILMGNEYRVRMKGGYLTVPMYTPWFYE